MKKIQKLKNLHFYLLLIVLIVGTFFRFYNYPYRYSIGEETVRDAVIGIEGARQLQFPLTGAFSSLGPFTFGPWYAYQLIIFNLLVPFVYSPWIYLSIISVLYIFIIYKIGELLGGKNFGLVLALLSAFSPAQIISATHLTSHNNTNLFAVLAIWIFLKLVLKNLSYWWGFFLGLVIGIGMNLHFQMSGLLILPLILLIYKRKRYLYFITAAAGVFTSSLPLLFFELNNHWFTTRNLIYYLLYGKNAIYVPNRWLFYLRDFWPSFWSDALGVPVWAGSAVIMLFLILLVISYRKKRLPAPMILLLLAFLFNFILLRYYWGPRFFGYLNFLRPFVFIFTAFTILNLQKTVIKFYGSILLLIFLIVLALPKTMLQLRPDPFTISMYQGIADIEKKYPNEKFVLYNCSKYYKSYYNASVFSILFLLELKHKASDEGVKLGLKSDCDDPQSSTSAIKKTYSQISKIGIIDFSTASESALLEAGWSSISFSKMYDSYARWWFKQQP